MAILGLFLSVSGLTHADSMNDLVNSSQAVANQLTLGYKTVAGIAYNAPLGNMSPTGMATQAHISEAQRVAYNNAVSAMSAATYYSAANFLVDRGNTALANMNTSVTEFTTAATSVATILEVQAKASAALTSGNATELQNVAEFVETNAAAKTLGASTITAYNTSLDNVETYAQEAAAYIGVSKNADAVAFFDNSAASANSSFSANEVTATFSLQNNWVAMTYANANYGSAVYFTGSTAYGGIELFKTSAQILTDGTADTLYTTSPSYKGYDCYFNNTGCP